MKKILGLLVAFLLLVTCLGVLGSKMLRDWSARPIILSEPVIVEFPKGTRLKELAADLKAKDAISQVDAFIWFVRMNGLYQRFQAGTYRFEGEVSPEQVAQAIARGQVYRPVVAQISIPEGFNLKQIRDRLIANGIGDLNHYNRMDQKAFLKRQGLEGLTLEGFLYPATYQFYRKPTMDEAFTEMVQTFRRKMPADYIVRLAKLNLNLAQAINIASMIELETRFDDEKSLVSEVIWRRLRNNEPLGIDAALIYGIPDYAGDIKTKHLQDANNKYNLRIHKGLPPTPIGSPSAGSLEAVLNPSNFGYNFYVLKPDGSGRHHFSRSLSEHQEHVKLLIEAQRKSREGAR